MTYCVGLRLDRGSSLPPTRVTNAGLATSPVFQDACVGAQGDRVLVRDVGRQPRLYPVDRVAPHEKDRCGRWARRRAVADQCPDDVPGGARRRRRRCGTPPQREGADRGQSEPVQRLLHLGGQIEGGPPRLFQTLQGGNFIEATKDTSYFQSASTKRQAHPRPRRQAGHAPGVAAKAPPDLLRFHAPLQPVGRHADRPPRLSQGRAAIASSAASTRTILITGESRRRWEQRSAAPSTISTISARRTAPAVTTNAEDVAEIAD